RYGSATGTEAIVRATAAMTVTCAAVRVVVARLGTAVPVLASACAEVSNAPATPTPAAPSARRRDTPSAWMCPMVLDSGAVALSSDLLSTEVSSDRRAHRYG